MNATTIFPGPKKFINEDEISLEIHRPGSIIDFAYLRSARLFTIAAYSEESGEPQSLTGAHLDLSPAEQHAVENLLKSLPQ